MFYWQTKHRSMPSMSRRRPHKPRRRAMARRQRTNALPSGPLIKVAAASWLNRKVSLWHAFRRRRRRRPCTTLRRTHPYRLGTPRPSLVPARERALVSPLALWHDSRQLEARVHLDPELLLGCLACDAPAADALVVSVGLAGANER